jgi:hypothetical protein
MWKAILSCTKGFSFFTEASFSFRLLFATELRLKWVQVPDEGYSCFSPFSDPMLSDVSCMGKGDD